MYVFLARYCPIVERAEKRATAKANGRVSEQWLPEERKRRPE